MKELPPAARLGQLITGYYASQAIFAAAKFGIADLLVDGSKSIEELAIATETKPELLYRVLRALASIGVFAEQDDKRFTLTPLAELLRSDVPGSQRSMALMMGEEHFLAWGNLADAVQTGDNAYEKVVGQPIFEHLAQHPEKAQIFDAAMTGIHGRETSAILDAYDFAGIDTLADIGGGNGSKLTAILQKYPQMNGILFDLEHVISRARPQIEAAGVLDRCQLISGDFFHSVPGGADAYVMRHIIHDWDDDRARTILKHCHSVMAPGNKLLVVESVIPPGNDPFMGKFLDLTMMLIPGGKERTADEYRSLYDDSGFDLVRIVPTGTEVSVIEGVRR
ncbi:Multifunctional cyclase-dehydratase-3-O-methyl transferase TcmN [Stieleria maiorica]|uniref:Multifunctional cyclase-dehydratase-3-O-methyl transferase TcmN n=1 Tax=Stieleria maiorica TaxID=2795974 RepID=A0A5B9MB23_9BACT|nr:methyltransferase [Stieleria maiorica]QEF98372.1 Multifunctional cyclase-dehydratase-3-O-methyl transferase TcmN [Stieleria maiorica]